MLPISQIVISPIYKMIAILIVVLSLMLGSVYFTAEYKDGQYAQEKVVLAEKNARALKEEIAKVRAKEQEVANLQTQLEGSYAKENERVNEVLLHYTDLINDGFRLRDQRKFAKRPASDNGSAVTTNSSNPASCSDELSAEATRFLLGLATDADKVVNQLLTCQTYAVKLHKVCSSPTGE